MSADHVDRAAEVIEDVIGNVSDVDDIAQALDAAGLLTAPEYDAAVAAKALRDAAEAIADTDGTEWPYGPVIDWLRACADRIEREAGESDADA